MAIYSHEQMPKTIMKSFSHKTGEGSCVFFYDFNEQKVKLGKIKTLGTKYGLFSDDMESLLDSNFEKPFSDITKAVRDFEKNEQKGLKSTDAHSDLIPKN